MGGGIAAHLANLGFAVSLLDVDPEAAAQGLVRARNAKPPHFAVHETSDGIRTGGVYRDLEAIRQADWVCEAIIEDLGAKRALYEEIEPLLREDALISTNTSGLELGLLSVGRSDSFRRRFMGTHFFNPPRYLKLIELIPGRDTDPAAVEEMTRFLEDHVARRVVPAKDTPGFIANRFGMWAMFHAVRVAEKLGLSIEQVDAITGPFLGRPRSASFRLNDLVGLDIMFAILDNLQTRCPDDPYLKDLRTPRSLAFLLEKGWYGEKTGQGFYRREGKELMALDLTTLAYRVRQEGDFPTVRELGKTPLAERMAQAATRKCEVGEFMREYWRPVLRYADWLKEQISHRVDDFDRVMEWGFGWNMGPFATIDALGADWVGVEPKRFYTADGVLGFEGKVLPRRHEPQYRVMTDFLKVGEHVGFDEYDLGDGVAGVLLTTKMGIVTPALVDSLHEWLVAAPPHRLVLSSAASHFSVGFDLGFFLSQVNAGQYAGIDEALQQLQKLRHRLATIPSVAAVHGYCLGGGFELASACTCIVSALEAQIGLPEALVGLIPCGGGTAAMRLRNQTSAKSVVAFAKCLAQGRVAENADVARHLGFLRRADPTEYHPDRVFSRALELVKTVVPAPPEQWVNMPGPLPGMIDQAVAELKKLGKLTDYDTRIGEKIRLVMGKAKSLAEAEELERTAALDLLHEGLTVARVKHMLEHGKPLRN